VAALLIAGKLFDLPALLREVLDRISGLGPWGPVVFVILYIAACVLFIPGSLLTLGAGVLFGVAEGSVLVSIASTAGATCAFLIGRYFARDWIASKLADRPAFRPIDEAVAREGWKIVGLTRLSPVFPFNLLNYAFGLTRVRLRDYVLASWVGMMPGTVLYVYVGSLAGSLASVGQGGRVRTPAEWALYLVGLAATLGVTVFVTRLARKALQEKIQ
jgi:uncharacterized membrane protein YdjX (TVP38/TMEM64 family)